MATEIERKFLVCGDAWRGPAGRRIKQGYLTSSPRNTVRVRIEEDRAWLTVKGPTSGCSRAEYEYGIPLEDAEYMLCKLVGDSPVEKTRYRVAHGGHTWDLDEYEGANRGLRTAEIELKSEDEPFERPSWLGEEVTGDPRYRNSELARHPWIAPASPGGESASRAQTEPAATPPR